MLKIVLLESLINIVDLVRREEGAETEDASGQMLAGESIEQTLSIHQQHTHLSLLHGITLKDKRLAPHPDSLCVAFASASVRKALLVGSLTAAFENITTVVHPLGDLSHGGGNKMLRIYMVTEIKAKHTLRVSEEAEEEVEDKRLAASKCTDNRENGNGNMVGDLWSYAHE